MTMAFLAQPEQQQTLEWLHGGLFTILLDSQATEGKLTVGRFDVPKDEAPPFHLHTQEDEVFLLLKGTALVWVGEERHEFGEGGIVWLPRNVPHGYRITSERADLLLIATPGGLEEMFRHAGRDITTPRPDHFEITKERLAEAAALRGNVIVGPPR